MLCAFLALVRVWTVVISKGLNAVSASLPGSPTMPLVLGQFVTGMIGFGLPAITYIGLRTLSIPTGLPQPAEYRSLLGSLLAPVILVAAVGLLGNAIFGTSP